ncbi:MAG TPA: YqeG family HAD IIIA-type phosphatase [Candidatus Lachnoclostridium avicola]|nr:YqeG family HAD IIIA-type phosphatase [Candidatus Lachnoclostridium avicola]
MFRIFYPKQRAASAYDIPYERLREKGIRGVIFDIDNTLVPHDAPAEKKTVELFERLHRLGCATCLLSNNKEKRVAEFAGQVDSPYIFKAGKPKMGGYEKAMKLMGTDRTSTLFVGDQLFTDVFGANRAGIASVLVNPINPREEIQIVLKRYPERLVLWFYERDRRKRR